MNMKFSNLHSEEMTKCYSTVQFLEFSNKHFALSTGAVISK